MELEKQLKKLSEDPENLDLICAIGKMYKARNDFSNAEKFFLKALQIDPDYCPATCSIVHILIDSGRYSDAFENFNNAIDSHSDDENYKATLFNALFAVFLLYKISITTPKSDNSYKHNYEELFFRIGSIFKNNDLYDASIKVFETTIRISRANARLLIELSDCYIKTDDFSKAEVLLLELLERYPEDLDIIEKLSSVYCNLKEYDTSIKYAEKILFKDPDNSIVKNTLAYCYLNTNRQDQAIDIYKKQLEFNPYDFNAYKNLFWAYKMTNNNDEAEILLNQIKESQPQLAQLLEQEISDIFD